MRIDVLTDECVREALRAIRYAKPLKDSPLLEMAALKLRLRHSGIPDSRQGREWDLGRYLDEVIWEHLVRLRGAGHCPKRGDLTPELELSLLAQDFRTGSAEIEAWSLLYIRYMGMDQTPIGDIAQRLGITERTLERRVGHGHRLLTEALRQAEMEASPQLEVFPGAPAWERVVVDEAAAKRDTPAAMAALLAAIQDRDRVVRLSPAQIQDMAHGPVSDLTAYRLARIAEWSQPHYRLDERFVALSLVLDQGEEAPAGRWWAQEQRFASLARVVEEVSGPAVVLLGLPGSGKSTLLRRLEMDLAIEGLRQGTAVVTFFVQLSRYSAPERGAEALSPWRWLSQCWSSRFPDMPGLGTFLARGQVVLLLDALNEMPHAEVAQYWERIRLWRQFVKEIADGPPGNRVLFACRSLDYSAPLSNPALQVPQVRIEGLSDEQIRRFLELYSPGLAARMWAQLEGSPQLELLRTPYSLKLLISHFDAEGGVPPGRAALFTGFVRQAVKREVERGNPLFMPDGLLTARDCERIVHARRWRNPYELPSRGALFRKLSELAYGMQEGHASGDASQVRVTYDEALALVSHERGEEILRAGLTLAVLDQDWDTDEVQFLHQLLQEYFAARRLAAAPQPDLMRLEWQAALIVPPLPEALAALDPGEPLPPLAATGWEQTALLAVAMCARPDVFVTVLSEVNLPLAGRCAAQPEAGVSAETKDVLRSALVARSSDLGADLRARMAAGLSLGELGDPRLDCGQGADGPFLLPPMITIPSADYVIGCDERVAPDEAPAHRVPLATFRIARFAVTNAEWACFMAAGGYEDPRWWNTSAAERWREGRGTSEGGRWSDRYWRSRFLTEPDLLGEMRQMGRLTGRQTADWQERLALNEVAFERDLVERWPDGRRTEPVGWRDEAFNNPAQPVSGISWYEARAYCAWLSAQTTLAFRLPTEVEWEAAARGAEGRRFAWGDTFAPGKTNTAEGRVLRPTPVGIYPDGRTPDGLDDITGNVYEWTNTLFGPDPQRPVYGYPHDASDGREDAAASSHILRIARGGSWAFGQLMARAANRGPAHPALRSDVGLRLLLAVST
jgi:formylglycine-generating enzyme required for sulfatase activity